MQEVLEKLKYFDDPDFKFEPKKHKYTYQGEAFISVTQFISRFHQKFDNDFWSQKKGEEWGISQNEVKKMWSDKNAESNRIGTALHNWIEKYFKKEFQVLPDDIKIIDRINKFNIVFANHLHKLTPVVFEVMVFSKKWKIAGTFDSIFIYKGKLYIIDWKTNSDFKDDEHPKGSYNKLLSPFEDFFQNHLNEYSIQVSLYALILEEAGIEVNGGYIVHFGPDTEGKIYKVKDMRERLRVYLDNLSCNQVF